MSTVLFNLNTQIFNLNTSASLDPPVTSLVADFLPVPPAQLPELNPADRVHALGGIDALTSHT